MNEFEDNPPNHNTEDNFVETANRNVSIEVLPPKPTIKELLNDVKRSIKGGRGKQRSVNDAGSSGSNHRLSPVRTI